jgi:ABC-type polysaccharide/polyol phosphate export permease
VSSLGSWFADYFCFYRKFLVYNLVLRNLKVRYRKSIFGMLWTVLIPAGSACVYYIVFSFVLKVNVQHHLLFIMAGLIPWTFFSTIHSLPLSETLTHQLNLLLSLPIIAVVMLISWVAPTWAIIQYPALLMVLFLISYSFSLICGLTYVYFRDLRFIVTLVLQFWFYLTPIMYTPEMVPERARFAIYLNPIGSLFVGLSTSVSEGRWLSGFEWAVILGWCAVMMLLSILIFYRVRDSVVEFL